MSKAYNDIGIELRIKEKTDAKYPKNILVEIKSTPATGQAGGTLEVTTHSDPTKVYIPDRPDTGDMDYTFNYTEANYTAVKAICDNTEKDILKSVSKKKYSFPEEEWNNVSNEAKDLIKHMLCDADKRFNAENVLNHPWIEKNAPNSKNILEKYNIESLKNFGNLFSYS